MLPCPGFRRSCRGHRVRAFPPAKAEHQEEAAAESGAADRRNRRDVQKARPGRCAAVGTDPPFSGRCRHTTLHAGRGIRSVLRRSGRDGGRAVGRRHPRRPAAFTRGKIQVQTQERHQQRKDPDGSVRAAIEYRHLSRHRLRSSLRHPVQARPSPACHGRPVGLSSRSSPAFRSSAASPISGSSARKWSACTF